MLRAQRSAAGGTECRIFFVSESSYPLTSNHDFTFPEVQCHAVFVHEGHTKHSVISIKIYNVKVSFLILGGAKRDWGSRSKVNLGMRI